MDRTMVSEAVVSGSIPDGTTWVRDAQLFVIANGIRFILDFVCACLPLLTDLIGLVFNTISRGVGVVANVVCLLLHSIGLLFNLIFAGFFAV